MAAALTRRNTLKLAAASLGSAVFDSALAQKGLPKVTHGVVARTGSAIAPTLLARNTALQEQFGVAVDVKVYPSVTTIWAAFASGEFDLLIGGPSNFATLAQRGAPVHIMSTYSIADIKLVGKQKILTADDLRGKRVTAITAGVWKLMEALIKKEFGLSPGSGYQMIPVANMMTGVTQVLAGTADYAMGWDPDATKARMIHSQLQLALSSADLRPKGEETHLQVVGSKNSVSPDLQKRATEALAAMMQQITKDPVAAEAQFAALTNAETGPFAEAVKLGQYRLASRLLTPQDKAVLKSDITLALPPNTTFPGKLFELS